MSNTETIKFPKTVNFLGRNGLFKSKGVEIEKRNNKIYIRPITSKGWIGRCTIEIPLESLEEFIGKLEII